MPVIVTKGQTLRGNMADRSGLKLVGFIFATVTLAVMLATGMVVRFADDAYSFSAVAGR